MIPSYSTGKFFNIHYSYLGSTRYTHITSVKSKFCDSRSKSKLCVVGLKLKGVGFAGTRACEVEELSAGPTPLKLSPKGFT
jgi:hypothetical protein